MNQSIFSRKIAVSLLAAVTVLPIEVTAGTQPTQDDSTANIITVTNRENIRVVYDVNHDILDAGIGKALYYVRGLLEAYKDMGVEEKALHISVVVHGAPAYWLLNSDAYQLHVGDVFAFNPNEKVVDELISHGVSVEVCHVTMKSKGWKAEDILPGVKIVHDGYTRIIDLQQQGYGYIAF